MGYVIISIIDIIEIPFDGSELILIHTTRMIDHPNHYNCSQNPPVTPSSIWWQSIRTESKPLGVVTYVIRFLYLEFQSD